MNDVPLMVTFLGKRFHPLRPDPNIIDPLDIAHSLSQQCRFGGHCRWPYSVAQHTVLGLQCLESGDPARPWFHMHDGPEAYVQDLVRPIKDLPELEPFRDGEHGWQKAFEQRFDLPSGCLESPAVHQVDMLMAALEVKTLMSLPPQEVWPGLPDPPSDVVITPWTSIEAEWRWLVWFTRLFPHERIRWPKSEGMMQRAVEEACRP